MNYAQIQAMPGPALAGGQGAAELAAHGKKGLPWRCCQGLPGCRTRPSPSVLSLDHAPAPSYLKAQTRSVIIIQIRKLPQFLESFPVELSIIKLFNLHFG